ncbi:MAG: hypothetical protein ABR946_02275 [Solirubrobacteraceae bacterium]|jgi:hypothetical protein
MRIWLSALAVAGVALAASVVLASAGASPDSWSAPATLPTCGAASRPKVVFPFSAPDRLVGSGAIVWLGTASCGAAATTIEIANVDGADRPQAPRALLAGAVAGARLVAPLYAVGTATGEIIAVAGSAEASVLGSPEAVAADGFATGVVERLRLLGGPDTPLATMDGFIGDADLATLASAAGGGYEIVVRAQRHYAEALHGRRILRVGDARPTALAIGMDFRADRLVVWAQGGEVWAQDITNDGRTRARQLLGPSGYAPQIAALLSDDDRAFVIWTDEPPPGAGGATQVLLAHSAVGPTFHGARTLASFTEPAGVRLTAGSVAAERLSDEGVALLWPAMANGNYVVDAAGVTQTGVRPPSILAEPGQDVRLAAVATGPENEFVVVVALAPRTASGFEQSHQELLATRSNVVRGTTGLGFGPLAVIAPSGPNIDPSVAIDPDTDAALAAWQTTIAGTPKVEYAVGSASG